MSKIGIERIGELKAEAFKAQLNQVMELYKETAPYVVAAGKDPSELLVNSVMMVATNGKKLSQNEKLAGNVVQQHVIAQGELLRMKMMLPAPSQEQLEESITKMSSARMTAEKAFVENRSKISNLQEGFHTLLDNQRKMDAGIEKAQEVNVVVGQKATVSKGIEIGN